MPGKPATVTIFPDQEQLESLYARLAAVDDMIEALEAYRRSRRKPTTAAKRPVTFQVLQFPSILRIRPDSSPSDNAPG